LCCTKYIFIEEKKDNLHFVLTLDTGMKCSIDLQ